MILTVDQNGIKVQADFETGLLTLECPADGRQATVEVKGDPPVLTVTMGISLAGVQALLAAGSGGAVVQVEQDPPGGSDT